MDFNSTVDLKPSLLDLPLLIFNIYGVSGYEPIVDEIQRKMN